MASERVFMRLEKMSCVERKTAEVIELTVDGYVSGEDGANGVRGILVDRSGPALRNAFIGGFVGGMGNFFGSQNANPLSIVGGGIANLNPMNAQQLLQSGASKGIGNSMEKLADFYIKRGEQLQPVLEVEGGRSVDVVFTSGFDMAQTLYRRTLMADNDQERRTVAQRPSQADQPVFGDHHSASPSSQGGFYDQR
jgi:conjugal transfer pilus assembly protein TraB